MSYTEGQAAASRKLAAAKASRLVLEEQAKAGDKVAQSRLAAAMRRERKAAQALEKANSAARPN